MPKFTTAAEAFEALSEKAASQNLAGVDAVILFDLAGEGGGQWTATAAEGTLSLAEGAPASPQVTIRFSADDFLALMNGEMNPIAAFMQGRIRVEGDVSVAMRLQSLFL
jgi:putative sterol carrier protein